MRRIAGLFAVALAAALVGPSGARAQVGVPGVGAHAPGTFGAPRHSAPDTIPENFNALPPEGTMPHPLYQAPGGLRPQQRESPGVNAALRDLYGNPLDKFYRTPGSGPGGNAMDPATAQALRRLYGGNAPLATQRPPVGAPPDSISSGASAGLATEDPEFRRYDLNGDGVISADEYVAARMRAARANPTAADAARRRMLTERFDARFRAADRNGDGRISPNEYGAVSNPRF